MRYPALAFCLFLALTAAAAAASTPEEEAANRQKFREDINEGIELLRTESQGENSRAMGRFKNALKLFPASQEAAEAYYWIALTYSDQSNYPRAAENIRDATVYDEDMMEAWLLWGQTLLYMRQYPEALEKLERASQLAPDDPFVLFNLGRVHYHGFKNADTALTKFRGAWQRGQALRRDNPEMIALTIRSRLYIGICEYDRGMRQKNPMNFESAINAFQDVLREQPNNYDAQIRLAMALRRVNRAPESASILAQITQNLQNAGDSMRPVLAEAYLQLGDLYLKEPQVMDRDSRLYAKFNLQAFLSLLDERSNHPYQDAVREYLAATEGGSAR